MFYPASASTVTSFGPVYPPQNHYYNAPMSAVVPGQQYYPTMHAAPMLAAPMHSAPMHAAPMMYPQTAAPVLMQQRSYNYGAPSYYGSTPTMILPSGRRHHRRHSSRRGFLGYL